MSISSTEDVARWCDYCAQLLQGTRGFLLEISDATFAARPRGADRAGVGTHVRHVLDAYTSLLDGAETGTIDYDLRTRQVQLERDREQAMSSIGLLIERLRKEVSECGDRPLSIRCDEPFTGEAGAASSLARELRFVASHTVHHQALIGELMREMGHSPPESFGVARSTLRHRESR